MKLLDGYPRIRRALALSCLSAAYLVAMGLEPTARNKDSARDVLLARDGLSFGIWEGCDAAFGQFKQGVLWIRFVALTYALDIGPFGQQIILTALFILSLCLFDRGVREHFGATLGWAPTAMFFSFLLVLIGYPNLWNPSFAPLGVACLMLALLRVVDGGSTRAACAGAASLALAAEGHAAALLAAPVLIAVVCLSCRQPVSALILSAISGVVPSFIFSTSTWIHDARAFLQESWYLPLTAAALAAGLGCAAALRRRWQSLGVARRQSWLLVMLVGGVTVQVAAASVLSHSLVLSPHYYVAALPALAILAGLGLRRLRASTLFGPWGRRLATMIAAFVAMIPMAIAVTWRFGISSGVASFPDYSIREAKLLASFFWNAGYSYPDVQRHLRGPDSFVLITSIAPFAPGPGGGTERPMPDLRVLAFDEHKLPVGGLPPDGREVELGHGRRAWILPLEGWVRLAPARVCFSAPAERQSPICAQIAASSIAYQGRYHDLAYPALPGVHDARDRLRRTIHAEPMKTTWELPIVITGDDAERYFDLAGVLGAPWLIEAVLGVGHRGELPSRHVVLDRSGELSGRIVLGATDAPWQDYPPDFLETRKGEDGLRDSIERLPPLGRPICRMAGTCP